HLDAHLQQRGRVRPRRRDYTPRHRRGRPMTDLPAAVPTPSTLVPAVPTPRPAPAARRRRLRLPPVGTLAIHAILIVGAFVMVGPLVWMVLTSLKTAANAEA